jgi:hypothetical protein
MKKLSPTRSLVIGLCALAIVAMFASIASAAGAPPIAPGSTPPPGTESFMVPPCTNCHTYTTPPSGGTTTTPVPTPQRICGNCHKDPGPGVVPPREDHPFLYGGSTGSGGEHDGENTAPKKPAKHAKKHASRKAKSHRVSHDD